MSSNLEAADKKCCASCGKAEGDGVQLRTCTACKSVRYCGVTCQRNHRPKHKKACKKRAAELRDEILFKQPESTHRGDCPLCCVPLPIEDEKTLSYSCCSKLICMGCAFADLSRQRGENIRVQTCPFCRQPTGPGSDEAVDKDLMKRAEANDPAALRLMGVEHFRKGECNDAFEYWTRAAELGDADAHYNLSVLYEQGYGIEKNEKKRVFHLEEAAIAGQPAARHNLACYEERNGRNDRAVKHLIIAANLGSDLSMQELKKHYKDGKISKEDFAAALRAHHAASDAMKSLDREAAEKVEKLRREMDSTSSRINYQGFQRGPPP